ncbi:MAG: T9SS type A sorting domain-containing protein [Bacteroidota bacterium]
MERNFNNIWIILLLMSSQLMANPSYLTCDALFSYQDYDGMQPVTGGITFINEATGDFENISWNFGDGNIESGNFSDTLDHFYAIDGVYSVCLSIWDDQGCLSTYCTDVVVGSISDICSLTDCVFPGDANDDGEANFYDLLELGVGQGITGPVRPNATTEWVGQLAPDWSQTTAEGVNYKHLDCDGNGIIDENDAVAIVSNYQVMDAPNPNTESSAPLIYIEFDQDTIYVDDGDLLSDIPVKVHLMVGKEALPAEDIYGLALYLGYPNDLVQEDSVDFHYHDDSFFGTSDEVIWAPNNQHDEEQVDIGVTRVDGFPVSGSGKVGEGNFIIDSDILDGRIDDGLVHFPVSVNGVRMIDEAGNELPINLPNTPATLVFSKFDNATSTVDTELSRKVKLYPNPATDKVILELGDLNGNQLEVFNNIGQRIFVDNAIQPIFELGIKDWNSGIYYIKIQTEQGVVSKRFLIEN